MALLFCASRSQKKRVEAKLLDVAENEESILDLSLLNEILEHLVFKHVLVDLGLLL